MISRRKFIEMSVVVPFIPKTRVESPPSVASYDAYRYILNRFPVGDYLSIIVEACRRQEDVFPIEPEIEVAKLWQESSFRPDAISLAGAVGIAQFIPETARDGYGMRVYVTRDYTDGVELRKRYLAKTRDVDAALQENRFDRVRQYKLEADELGKQANTAFTRYKQDIQSKISGKSLSARIALDQRLDPELSIQNGVQHLAEVSRACADRFGGSVRHNVLRGLAAYNAGLDQVLKFDGMPFLFQTVDYVRKIMVTYDRLIALRDGSG